MRTCYYYLIMESPKFNVPSVGDTKKDETEAIKFHKAVGYEKRMGFQKIVDQLPDPLKKVFLEFRIWRNAPISLLDYNLACTLRDYSAKKLAGDQTETFLCESLKEAMQVHTDIKVFWHHFDAAWRKRMPTETDLKAEAKKKRIEISAQSLKEREQSGGTYTGSGKGLGAKGWIHRKPGHA